MKTKKIMKTALSGLIATIMIQSCTSSLFVIKGRNNKIETEQNVKADSTSINVKH